MVATHSGQQSLDLDLREQALASIPRLSGDKVAVAFQLTGARQSVVMTFESRVSAPRDVQRANMFCD